MGRHGYGWLLATAITVVASCSLELDPDQPTPTVARFDPGEGVIPLPSDLVLDEQTGRLDLPIEDDMTVAEQAFRAYLNEGHGWSTTFPAKVEFSGPVARQTITPLTFQIWEWSDSPMRIEWAWEDEPLPDHFEGPLVEIDDERMQLSVDPPRHGWTQGGKYGLLVRGGGLGVHDEAGLPVDMDTAFFFVRMRAKLDLYANQRAFPGATRDERLDNARKLEEIRVKLHPFFSFFEGASLPVEDRLPREELVALWSFTVTTDAELAMDKRSQRMPIPFDVLVDPDTGLVDLSDAPWDTELERDAKHQLNKLDGFGVSANLMFELTEAVDPTTADTRHVRLFRLGDIPSEVPIERIMVMAEAGEAPCQTLPPAADCKQLVVVVDDASLPLEPRATYALVASQGLRAADGGPLRPMLIGHFMRTPHPLVLNGVNQLESVPDDEAARLELSRAKVAVLLDTLGRTDVVTAWPFTTLDVQPAIERAINQAATLGTPTEIQNIKWQTLDMFNRDDAFDELFPGVLAAAVRDVYALRLRGVSRVVEGTIKTPYFLDRVTRRMRPDGDYELEDVHFLMTIPESAGPGNPAPVILFAHAIVTDRRFLLTIAGELAERGFAAIAIDLPFHGLRTVCVERSLVAIPNFLSDELKDLLDYHDNLIMLPPCLSGDQATCSPTGECIGPDGQPEPLNNFLTIAGKPAVMDMKPASGAAFLDIGDIPHISDHFVQAVIDLGALKHVLRNGDWEQASGYPIRTDRFYMAGQSLGGILSAVFAAVDPDIERVVLNVPGADLVELFMDSTYFAPHFDDFFLREQIADGSFEQERLLNIARWLIDSVDPHSVAHLYRESGRAGLIQMDSGWPNGDIIIPNRTTRVLQRVSGLPMREYNSILHADLVVPLLGDAMLGDMAAFLAGEINE